MPAEVVPERAGVVSVLSNQGRNGDWVLPRLFRALAFMGSVEIDLTRARVGPGKSLIEVRAFMGNIEILVPPDLRVDCDVSPVLGNVEAKLKGQPAVQPGIDAPLISIRGTAFMGNVEVKVVDPNAPDWIDRLKARFM